MSYLSKHYFCICNCRLNAFMSVCKYIYATSDEASVFPLHCKDEFVDTDLNCLVTAKMSYYSN